MLTLITLSLLGTVLLAIGFACYNDLLKILGFVLVTALTISLLSFININSRFKVQIEEYNNLKAQIEAYNNLPDSCKNVSLEFDMRRDAVAMNNIISNHDVMSKSGWVNLWYSKEIGSLPKLNVYTKHQ